MKLTATYPLPIFGAHTPRYRYFFNGQEADNEVLGGGASFSAEFWQYDTRLGRRWNVDPVFKEYESPYACFAGNPVWLKDPLGKSSWKPDSGALAQNNEVRFIAEADDNLQTLSIQSGISLEQLENNYRGLNIVEGQSYSFDKITSIKLMNDFLQNYNNTEYNCMFFAMYVNGVPSPPFSVLPEIVLNNFTNLSSPSEAKIGDIITYNETFDEFYFHYRGEAVSYTDEAFKEYYNDQLGFAQVDTSCDATRDILDSLSILLSGKKTTSIEVLELFVALRVPQVRLLHVQVFGPGTADAQTAACLAHGLVRPLAALP